MSDQFLARIAELEGRVEYLTNKLYLAEQGIEQLLKELELKKDPVNLDPLL
jgi:hypothetical protein